MRRDGTRFWASGVVSPLRDEAGGLRGFAKVMRDDTERKRLEEELRRGADELAEADRRKDEFLAMLAHELRNPLAPIRNALRADPASTDATRRRRSRRATIAERQVGHLARLVDDLLDVSRITRGKIQLRTEPVDLATVVGPRRRDGPAADRGQRPRADGRACPPGPIRLEADPTRLEQVLANLLNNAAKYTEPRRPDRADGRAARATRPSSGCATPASASPPRCCPRVFDLFAQADRSLDRVAGGPGDRPDAGPEPGRDARRQRRRRQRRARAGAASSSSGCPCRRRRAGPARRRPPRRRPRAGRRGRCASWSWTTTSDAARSLARS